MNNSKKESSSPSGTLVLTCSGLFARTILTFTAFRISPTQFPRADEVLVAVSLSRDQIVKAANLLKPLRISEGESHFGCCGIGERPLLTDGVQGEVRCWPVRGMPRKRSSHPWPSGPSNPLRTKQSTSKQKIAAVAPERIPKVGRPQGSESRQFQASPRLVTAGEVVDRREFSSDRRAP